MESTANTSEIETKIGSLEEALKKTQDLLLKYAAGVTDFLSGPAAANTQAKPKRVAAPGKKLGRPLGSKNRPKSLPPSGTAAVQRMGEASTSEVVIPKPAKVPSIAAPRPLAVPDQPADKPLHPVSVELFHRVKKEGKVRLADLADGAKINRSLVHYHMKPLVEKGKVVLVRHVIKGHENDVAYTPKEAAKYFASM